jgi:hypothetical protein
VLIKGMGSAPNPVLSSEIAYREMSVSPFAKFSPKAYFSG